MLTWNTDQHVPLSLRLVRGVAMGVALFAGAGLIGPSLEPAWADQVLLFAAMMTLVVSFVRIT